MKSSTPHSRPPVMAVPYDPSSSSSSTLEVTTSSLNRLSDAERRYVQSHLKRRDRVHLAQILNDDRKRTKSSSSACETPLRIRVLQSNLPPDLRTSVFEDLRSGGDHKFVQWVNKALRLPLGVVLSSSPSSSSSAAQAVRLARERMDAVVTGHEAAKCEVLKLVCQAATGGTCASAYSLGLEGPPGTGKTHFAKHALSAALGRPMQTIPLGGASDAAYLLGNGYTYEGSKEGRLATALVEAGCCNPILYFDEVDKISATERGQEIASVLIHLVDPTANTALRDRYFHGIDLDFSRCTFVFSYNDPSKVSPILLDRIKRISMSTPSAEERAGIVRDHLVPRAQARLHTSLALSEEAISSVLLPRSEARGGGMRATEKDVDHVLAAAQLCHEAGTDGTGALVGVAGERVLDPHGNAVSEGFVARCLSLLDADLASYGGMPLGPSPPSGMYT